MDVSRLVSQSRLHHIRWNLWAYTAVFCKWNIIRLFVSNYTGSYIKLGPLNWTCMQVYNFFNGIKLDINRLSSSSSWTVEEGLHHSRPGWSNASYGLWRTLFDVPASSQYFPLPLESGATEYIPLLAQVKQVKCRLGTSHTSLNCLEDVCKFLHDVLLH